MSSASHYQIRVGDREHDVFVRWSESSGQSPTVTVDGHSFECSSLGKNQEIVRKTGETRHILVVTDPDRKTGRPRQAWVEGQVHEIQVRLAHEVALERALNGEKSQSNSGKILAPMPGRVVRVLVKAEQTVIQGEPIMIVEAMKMENEIQATCAGVIDAIMVEDGDAVESGGHLCSIRPSKQDQD